MNIVTLTLNPAFDVHCTLQELRLYKENYGTYLSRQAGGKGINLSRALNAYGIENTAVTVVGTENGDEFKRGLEADGISYLPIMAEGRIRENLTIHSPNMPETRISFEGFQTEDSLLHQIRLLTPCSDETMIAFSGRIPAGLSKQAVLSFLSELKQEGAKLVIDCNSFSTEEIIQLQPMMMKPNQQEISQLAGREMDLEQTLEFAEMFHSRGVEHVLVSFGEKGMVYAGQNGSFQVSVPGVSVVSTVGAGDSAVAGFLAGMTKRLPFCDILRLSAAFGTAACKTPGTNPPRKREIDELFEKIDCKKTRTNV